MTHDLRFNLVDEPWVCVRDEEGAVREVSLLELFEQASHIKCLANDLPTQDFAILRVLLAILQRALLPTLDEDSDPVEVWVDLWNTSEFPMEEISEYLRKWRGRFDLFDSEKPFMQVAGLNWKEGSAAEKGGSNLKRIIADVPSRDEKRFFTQRIGRGLYRLDFSEAARWLIHLQAFDVGSPGSPVSGEAEKNIKMGKVYPGATGWGGMLGCFYLEGESLKETILLNFLPNDRRGGYDLYSVDDLPSWESDSLSVSDGHDESRPNGRADLFTWQSRWVRLLTDGSYVTDAIVSAGKKLEKGDCLYLRQFETMTAWRIPADAAKVEESSPLKHPFGAALWRGLLSLFGGHDVKNNSIRPPELIEWLDFVSESSDEETLNADDIVRVHALGLDYSKDSSHSKFTGVVDDYLELSSFLLSRAGKSLVVVAKECADSTSGAIRALGDFAANLCLASGGSGKGETDGARRAAMSLAFFEIDLAFRTWLSSLNKGSNAKVERARWHRIARLTLRANAAYLLTGLGPEAVVGAPIRDSDNNIVGWMTASSAERKLDEKLRQMLPLEEDGVISSEKEAR